MPTRFSISVLSSAVAGVLGFAAAVAPVHAATPSVTIDAARAAGPISPRLYGLMTEEINHSYDGGLYAELIQNRSFRDDAKAPAHWSAVGGATLALDTSAPLNESQPVALRVEAKTASADAPAGVANEGYWGIPVMPATTYRATFFAKAVDGFDGPLTLAIRSTDGKSTYATAQVTGLAGEWKKYEAKLTTAADIATTSHARYSVTLDKPGAVLLSVVSLFPPTYNDRPNGLRKDLMQMLVDLKPKFLRFPGGNYVEGNTFETRYEWKKTIGPIETRPGHPGCWGYRSSDGMGLLEFLEWTQDMGAEPVLAVFAGYTLDKKYVEAGPALEPYVTEAMEEIEYVIGGPDTVWGARRIKDGHPEPFPLHYVEIGNEDFFDTSNSYQGRFAQFYDAIKKKYPQLKIISSVGNEQPQWVVKSRVPDVVDEHYYRSAEEFVKMSPTYYEQYDRSQKRPEIFVGEWAAHEDGKIKPWFPAAKKQPPTPAMLAAIGDAAFMAAMERNGDLIVMHCYAPMLVNVNHGAWQWRPDLIGYDATHVFGSPSYHAFKMFSTRIGDERLALKVDGPVQASATRDGRTGEVFLKLVNPTAEAATLHVDLKGVSSVEPTARVLTLAAGPTATNSLQHPTTVVPVESTVDDVKPQFDTPVPANGIVVMTLKTR